MVEGTPESAILVIRLIALILKGLIGLAVLPFKGLFLLGRAGFRLFARWRRPAPKLIDFDIRRLPDGFRAGIQWAITIEGRTYRISSVDDLPEQYRESMRERLALQAEGIRGILGRGEAEAPAELPAPRVGTSAPKNFWAWPNRPQDDFSYSSGVWWNEESSSFDSSSSCGSDFGSGSGYGGGSSSSDW